MIVRNFIVKNLSEHNAKFRLKIPNRYREIVKKNEKISLRYDVNDHVYTKSKSIQLRTDLANIEVIRILTLR